jgi:hypothetical protein
MSINIIVAIAGICLIDLCYIFVIHTQQDATQRNKKLCMILIAVIYHGNYYSQFCHPFFELVQ